MESTVCGKCVKNVFAIWVSMPEECIPYMHWLLGREGGGRKNVFPICVGCFNYSKFWIMGKAHNPKFLFIIISGYPYSNFFGLWALPIIQNLTILDLLLVRSFTIGYYART